MIAKEFVICFANCHKEVGKTNDKFLCYHQNNDRSFDLHYNNNDDNNYYRSVKQFILMMFLFCCILMLFRKEGEGHGHRRVPSLSGEAHGHRRVPSLSGVVGPPKAPTQINANKLKIFWLEYASSKTEKVRPKL
jgi:hypothetical protein